MGVYEQVPPLIIIRDCVNQTGDPKDEGVDLVICPPENREAIKTANKIAPVTAKIELSPFLCTHSPFGHQVELRQEISRLLAVACFHTPSLEELTHQEGRDNTPMLWAFGLAAASAIVPIAKIHQAKKILVLALAPLTSVIEFGFLGPDFLESPRSSRPWEHDDRSEIYIGSGWGPNHNDQY